MTTHGMVDVAYLDQTGKELGELKRDSYARLHLLPGHRVIDVGCGPASDTLHLAEIVGPNGTVVGIDADPEAIDHAELRAVEAGVSGWVTHTQAEAGALPFPDASFDASRSERLFQHLADAAAALAELSRVTRPEGRVVVVDTDWATMSLDAADTELERRITRFHVQRVLRNGPAGRQLWRLFHQLDLADISIDLYPIRATSYPLARRLVQLDRIEMSALAEGVVTAGELSRWRDHFAAADALGHFYGHLTMVMASGRKS